jgi:hypothetical protein
MPFTLSHPAAVLPFARPLARWQLLSAVVIGSMVPDFGFFSPWRPDRFETHSAMGLLTFCLPVGLASYWTFQYLIKGPVIELFPEGAYERWRGIAAPAAFGRARQWILAACGILAGAVTHLVWDGFTHEGARGVRMIPALDDPIVEIGGHQIVAYRLLQDGSSLIGLAVVLGVVGYALRRGLEPSSELRPLGTGERRAWVIAYVATALLVGTGCYLSMRFATPHRHWVTAAADRAAIASLRGLASAVLIVSACLKWRLHAGSTPART